MKFENVGNPQQYSQLKATTNVATITMEDEKAKLISQKTNSGIGIVEFFEGKNIFVTGATGFLGKGTF